MSSLSQTINTKTLVNTEKNPHDYNVLKLYVNNKNPELMELYKKHVENHDHHIFNDPFPNSGFDLFIPENVTFDGFDNQAKSKMIDLEIKGEMLTNNSKSSAFYLYPRSSISKTPLLLSNHVGIVDSGYRGFIAGAFRNMDSEKYTVEKHTRLLQICHPSLSPVYVKMVKDENELSTTSRGSGGFGSTGK